MAVFISEYVEGSGNNKAIELYNTGGTTVSLSSYSIELYADGSGSASTTFNFDVLATIAAGDTYVVTHSQAAAALLNLADETSSLLSFDGDDAIVLKSGSAILDSIGQIGFDPGSEWGAGVQSTQNNTLRRKDAILTGDIDLNNPQSSNYNSQADNAFDPLFEWEGFASDTFSGLGAHTVVTTNAPSAQEQMMVQFINRARENPFAEMQALFNTGDPNIDGALAFFANNADLLDDGSDNDTYTVADMQAVALSQVANFASRAPLAWNTNLAISADTHNDLMNEFSDQTHDITAFEHGTTGNEPGLFDRILAGGYEWQTGISVGENIFGSTDDPLQGHAGFYIDWGFTPSGIQSPPGHRNSILSTDFRDVGIAYAPVVIPDPNEGFAGPYTVTQHFGYALPATPKIVGVAIDDMDDDDFYDIGEGLGGITVTASGGGQTFSTVTWASGGYALAVNPNVTYQVTFSGAALGADQSFTTAVATDNVAVDAEAVVSASDISLTPDILETGEYGNKFNGQFDADGIITAGFAATGTDLVLDFKGYDIDNGGELELFLNGVSKGFVDAGVNNGLADYSIAITAAEQVAGENIITFEQATNPAYKWGITDLLLSEGTPADIFLTVDALKTGEYGNKFNGQFDADGIITASFDATGTDLVLDFKGYDIDNGSELELFLNGVSQGFVGAGVNNGLEDYSLTIAAADQVAGENIITFEQAANPAYKWGITDLLLSEVITADISLTIGTLETGEYGNKFNGQFDADGVVTAGFAFTGTDLELEFKGYDIDNGSELELFLNGVSQGFVDAGVNNGLEDYTLTIAAADQVAGENFITFEQAANPAYKWGITDLLLNDILA